ncbi:MAG: hypothetical protein JXR22_00975, partial [Prolixibacteraceae bacterium]|nr:hypothetical protein [Prolixibacteraceae bacterium]
FELYILWVWMAFLSLNGIMGGGMLMIKPDGSLLGMQANWLDQTSFPDFFVPGFLLLLFNGIFPLIALWGLIWKKEVKAFSALNPLQDKHWSWTFTAWSGIITIWWIIIQQLITSFFILQPIIAAIGLMNLMLVLMPRIQMSYTLNK